MPVQLSYPGVYVQEVPSGVRTITGVSTSVAMFIGMATKGPMRVPTRVLSFADYERSFGTDIASGELTDQVRQFFLNGGSQAFIMRLANGDQAATGILQDEFGNTDVLVLEARSAGVIGNSVRVRVDYDTSSPESTFNLTVFREEADPGGVIQVVESETFKELTMRPTAPNYVVDVLNLGSGLVEAKAATPPPAIKGFSIAGVLMDATTTSGVEELDTILTAQGGEGRFRISVDGAAFVTAKISAPADATAAAVNTAIAVPVNAALGATGTSITATVESVAGFNVLVIESSSADGSVRIAPAPSGDIAVAMQMGSAQGGLEVDGYASQRPAPTGFSSLLGALGTGAGDLVALQAFVTTDPNDVTSLTVTDNSPTAPHLAVGLTSWPGDVALPALSKGALSGPQKDSLRNVQENLDYLVGEVNATTGPDEIPWRAERHGFRVRFTPEFGGPDADLSAKMVTAGGTDLGSAGGILGTTPNVHSYRLGAGLPSSYQASGADGENGDPPELKQYQDALPIIDRKVGLFNIMALPRAANQDEADRAAAWPAASAFCQQRRAFLLVDPPEDWSNVDKVTDGTTGVAALRIGLVKDHSAIYWPRLRIAAPEGGERVVDPSGSIAGLMSRIDSNRGVWKAPAGIEADILGVRGVERDTSDAENGIINPEAVNAIRVFPNGVVSWGARTMDGFDNSGNDDYKYVPVRRLALFLEESLYRGLQFAVFEPNDEPLWAQIRLAAGAFMNNLFRQGAFQGQKASEAYFVKVDSETTTQNDINLGIVNVLVGFAPLKPAEFVIITLQQMAGQVQV